MRSESTIRRRVPKVLRAVLYVACALALLLTLGAVLMGTSWFRRALERQVRMRIEEFTGGRVEIREVRFNPLILQITLKGLTIHGSEAPSEPPLFTAQTVVARLSLVPLARRKLRWRTLDWENAALHVITNPDDTTNIPRSAATIRPGQAMEELVDLSIGRVTLGRTQIRWNNRDLALDLVAHNLAFLLRQGGSRGYQGSLSSSGTLLTFGSWTSPPLRITGQFELTRGALSVSSLAWESEFFTGSCSLALRNPNFHEGSFSFRAAAAAAPLASLLDRNEVRGGTVSVQGTLDYARGRLLGGGRLEARDLLVRSPWFDSSPVNLSSGYQIHGQRVEFPDVVLNGWGGQAQGRARMSYQGGEPEFFLDVQVRDMEMASVLGSVPPVRTALLRIPHVARINGTTRASWRGALSNFASQFDLRLLSEVGQPTQPLALSGHASGRLALGRGLNVDLSDVKLQTLGSMLRLRGAFGSLPSRLHYQFETTDLEEWRPLVEFLGRVDQAISVWPKEATASGAVTGSLRHPEIAGSLQCEAFRYGTLRWDNLTADFVAGPDLIRISSGRARRGEGALSFEVSAILQDWTLTPASFVRLSAEAHKVPLETSIVAATPDHSLLGLASGSLGLEGPSTHLIGNGELRVEQLVLGGESFDFLSAKLRVAGSRWDVENIRLAKGAGRLEGTLRLDRSDGTFSAGVRGLDFALSDFRTLSHFGAGAGGTPELDGRLGFHLSGEGSLEEARLTGDWTVRGLQVGGDAFGELHGQVHWQGKRITLEGRSEGPRGLASFRAETRPEPDWPFELSGEYDRLHIEPWIRSLLNKKLGALVIASGDFAIGGPLKDPHAWVGQGRASRIEVRFPAQTWQVLDGLKLRYSQGKVIADRFRMRGPSTDLEVEGSATFGESTVLLLNAQGEADLALLDVAVPGVQASGHCDVNVQVRADLTPSRPTRPSLKGSLVVREGSLKYADLPVRVSGLNGGIRLEGERAIIDSLRGSGGGGSITLSGFATLAESVRYDLHADLQQVRIAHPRDFTPLVNGNLRWSGTPERSQLAGELTVRQVFVSESFNLLAQLLEMGPSFEKYVPSISSPTASRIGLNVQLISGGPLRLETQEGTLFVDVDLSVQGTLANPVELGSIYCRSGEVFFRGNRYKLNRGELRLSNPVRREPLVDLEASTRVQRYELTVDISGPLDRLKLAYRSDPPLPTEEILSLLALGFSQQQSQTSTAPGQALPAVQAGALLSQALSGQMSGRAQRLFGVSRIKVDPNVGGVGSPGGARVTFEQQVGRDLTLTYVTSTATSQYRLIQFEWAVSENTSLVGVRDQSGIFGVEVRFRKRFH